MTGQPNYGKLGEGLIWTATAVALGLGFLFARSQARRCFREANVDPEIVGAAEQIVLGAGQHHR